MLKQIPQSIIAFILLVSLAGCVTTIDGSLPRDQVDTITVATKFNLFGSPSHPTSQLPLEPVPAGAQVHLLAADTNAAYFLVQYENKLGWMPSFFSQMGISRVVPPLIIEPLDGACTQYVGATFAPDEAWTNSTLSALIVEGSILLDAAQTDLAGAVLQAEVSGSGTAVASDYLHLPLTPSSNLVLFAFALQNVAQGSQISFTLDGVTEQAPAFQATFFTDQCGEEHGSADQTDKSLLAVGQLKTTLPTPLPTPGPTEPPTETATSVGTPPRDVTPDPRTRTPAVTPSGPTARPGATISPTPMPSPPPTPTTIRVTSGPRLTPPTQAEIQELVDQWDQIHHEVDRTLDPTDLPLVLTGGALQQQEKTLRDLKQTQCYWEFTDLAPSQITEWQEISVNEVIVTMRKHWDGRVYCKGKLDTRYSFDEPFFVRYQIVRTNQGWRIAEKVPLDSAVEIATPRAPAQPQPTATAQHNSSTADQLYDHLITKSRNSRVAVDYTYETDLFASTLVYRLDEFQLSREGISQQSMTNLLYQADSGDRLNGLIQEVWRDWRGLAADQKLDPYRANPQDRGLSAFRVLVVRMIQGTQGGFSANQQRALHNYFSRRENPNVWHSDVKGVIGAINRENF